MTDIKIMDATLMSTGDIIEHAAVHHCRGRPAKRAALQLAAILVKERQNVRDLVRAEILLVELCQRIQRAKV